MPAGPLAYWRHHTPDERGQIVQSNEVAILARPKSPGHIMPQGLVRLSTRRGKEKKKITG